MQVSDFFYEDCRMCGHVRYKWGYTAEYSTSAPFIQSVNQTNNLIQNVLTPIKIAIKTGIRTNAK